MSWGFCPALPQGVLTRGLCPGGLCLPIKKSEGLTEFQQLQGFVLHLYPSIFLLFTYNFVVHWDHDIFGWTMAITGHPTCIHAHVLYVNAPQKEALGKSRNFRRESGVEREREAFEATALDACESIRSRRATCQ